MIKGLLVSAIERISESPEKQLVVKFKGEEFLDRFTLLKDTRGETTEEVILTALQLLEHMTSKHLAGTKFFEQDISGEIEPITYFSGENDGPKKVICITDRNQV